MFGEFDGEGQPTRVHVPKTGEIVADKIRAQIVRGVLKEGDSLPPEGQLIETFGISRPTLREAFRILEAEGLINVVRGSRAGARVYRPSVELVARYAGYVLESQGTTISDLYQARLAIEPSVVRWLSSEGGSKRTGDLRQLLYEMERMLDEDRQDDFIENVEQFHQLLVASTGLNTITFMSRMLLSLAGKHQREFQKRHPTDTEMRSKGNRAALRSYKKVVNLIEAGDVEEAVAHWRLHLTNANATWTGDGEGNRIVDSIGT